jgi:hypothetical protein
MCDPKLPAHRVSLAGARARGARCALLAGVLAFVAPALAAEAQEAGAARSARVSGGVWRDPAADSLVARAIALRGRQLADSTLLSYQADARGFLAFLAQLGEGVVIPPRVVQSEQLALRISWWQPGRSAQRLVGRRDTTLLPADVGYYRDRYGVVLDNLPDRIRLGDGQDVRDVAHPLGATAPRQYEYTMGSAVRIGLPGRDILVDEVKFRPRDGTLPGAIGSVYLDRETAAVVRLSMTFTRAAILDKRIETLVVTLENGLRHSGARHRAGPVGDCQLRRERAHPPRNHAAATMELGAAGFAAGASVRRAGRGRVAPRDPDGEQRGGGARARGGRKRRARRHAGASRHGLGDRARPQRLRALLTR